jgi:flagellar assembly protein FliH
MNEFFSDNILKEEKITGSIFYNISNKSSSQIEKSSQQENKPEDSPSFINSKHVEKIRRSAETSGYKRGLHKGQQQGYAAGRQEGLEIGFKQGALIAQDQFKDAVSMLNLIAASLQIKREEIFELLRPEMIKFNIRLMEKLLQEHLKNPSALMTLIEKLLLQIQSTIKDVPIKVLVSPEDYQIINQNLANIDSSSATVSQIHLLSDVTVQKGNCRLETTLGMLNYDIPRLMKDLEIKVLEV